MPALAFACDAFDRRLRVEVAVAAEEPEAVAHDRAAERDAGVVGLDDPGFSVRFGWRGDLVVQVVAARPLAGIAVERVPENVLPPERGMMFMIGPPMSLSPRPPPTLMAISSTFTVS